MLILFFSGLRVGWSFLQNLSRATSIFLRPQLHEITVSTAWIHLCSESNTIGDSSFFFNLLFLSLSHLTQLDQINTAGVFLQTGIMDKWKAATHILEKCSIHSETRIAIFRIFSRQTMVRTRLIGFQTAFKSDKKIIDLRCIYFFHMSTVRRILFTFHPQVPCNYILRSNL